MTKKSIRDFWPRHFLSRARPQSTNKPCVSKPTPHKPDNPFKDLVICLGGKIPGYKQVSLVRMIQNLGAVYSRKLTVQCTHLVTTEREVRRNSDKVRKAYNAYTCEIVSHDWLLDSYTAQKPLPEEDYAIAPEDEAAGGIKATPGQKTGMKRILDEVLDDMADRPNKRPRTDSIPSAKAGNGQVRVHPESLSHPGFSTYIDPSGNTWDALLVRSTASGKSNHFYRIQLLIDVSRKRFINEACWGRIGESAAQYRSDVQDRPTATAEFQRRFRSQTGGHWCFRFLNEPRPGKYRYIGQGSGDMEGMTRAKCSLRDAERMVMELIFQEEMPQVTSRAPSSTVYKCRKLPLGTLGKDTLAEGCEALQRLADVIEMPSLARSRYAQSPEEVRVMLSSQYFSIIPHVFGRNRPPVISTQKQIRKELLLLDELADRAAQGGTESVPQNDHLHPLDMKFQSLDLQEFTRVTHTAEYNHLSQYFYQSAGSEAFQILHIYRLLRPTEPPRHPPSNTNTNTNRRLLWHGSRNPNLASILRHGLKIRPSGVAHNGASMGKGIYFSDSTRISINYTSASASALPSAFALAGTQHSPPGMLLLCEVDLGNHDNDHDTHKKSHSHTNTTPPSKQKGYSPDEVEYWRDARCIHGRLAGTMFPRNEIWTPYYSTQYVVFDPARVRIRYLVFIRGWGQ